MEKMPSLFMSSKATYDLTNVCSSMRIPISIASAAICICLGVLRATNTGNINSSTAAKTFVDLAGSALLQNAVQVALPRKYSNNWKSAIADYSLPLFLTISQIYLNTYPNMIEKEVVFSFLTALGGMSLAAFIHNEITAKLNESDYELPLIGSSESRSLDCLFPTRPASRLRYYSALVAGSIGALIFNAVYARTHIIRDLALVTLGSGSARILCEGWIHRLNTLYAEIIDRDAARKKEPFFHQNAMKIFLGISHTFPGFLFPLIGAIERAKFPYWYALGGFGFFLVGALDGSRRHFEQVRFSNVDTRSLNELRKELDDLNQGEKVFRVAKWGFGILGVGSFLGLAMAGFNPQTQTFQPAPPSILTALISFTMSLYGSYTIAGLTAKGFTLNPDTSVINTLFFYTRYSIGIPLLGMYILEKMQIGDDALARDTVLAAAAGCAAYFSIGSSIGLEASARGWFYHPRTLSAIGFAMIGRFIAHRAAGEA